jgi:hypothetical protein
MENSANVMRLALILSIIAHVVFVTFSARDLRPTAHGEAMTVDLVPANEAPAGTEPKTDASAEQSKDAKPEPKADAPSATQAAAAKVESKPNEPKALDAKTPEAKVAQAKPAPPAPAAKPTEQQPPQQQPPQPTEQQSAAQPPAPDPQPIGPREMPPDMNRLADMLGLPIGDAATSGTTDARMSKFTEGVKEFKAQVKKCLTLPPGIAPNQRMKMVIRVELTRQGALAQDPAVMDAVNPSVGYPLLQSVIRALRQCAPYSLPPDKYKEWRVLDIDFSPDQMMGS